MKKKSILLIAILFLATGLSSIGYGVSFPDYFPLDTTTHGQKTFQWTYGRTGTYQSYISGSHTVPYLSGAIECTGIANHSGVDFKLYAANDGSEVKLCAFDIDNELSYISTDCNLTDHPPGWTFSEVTDDMILDQGTYYFVDPNLTSCEMDNIQSLLFDIQSANVPFGQYNDVVIIWWLDEQYGFTALDFGGKDIDLGITLPNATQTGGRSVTAFDVYAYGIGMIAYGDIEAEDGILNELTELVGHDVCGDINHPYPTGDMNSDCEVEITDAVILALAWLSEDGGPGWNPDCDISITSDGSINGLDFAVFGQHWRECTKPECD